LPPARSNDRALWSSPSPMNVADAADPDLDGYGTPHRGTPWEVVADAASPVDTPGTSLWLLKLGVRHALRNVEFGAERCTTLVGQSAPATPLCGFAPCRRSAPPLTMPSAE